MLDEKDLQAIAEMMDSKMDAKLEPIKSEITGIKLTLENVIQPQIDGLAEISKSFWKSWYPALEWMSWKMK